MGPLTDLTGLMPEHRERQCGFFRPYPDFVGSRLRMGGTRLAKSPLLNRRACRFSPGRTIICDPSACSTRMGSSPVLWMMVSCSRTPHLPKLHRISLGTKAAKSGKGAHVESRAMVTLAQRFRIRRRAARLPACSHKHQWRAIREGSRTWLRHCATARGHPESIGQPDQVGK